MRRDEPIKFSSTLVATQKLRSAGIQFRQRGPNHFHFKEATIGFALDERLAGFSGPLLRKIAVFSSGCRPSGVFSRPILRAKPRTHSELIVPFGVVGSRFPADGEMFRKSANNSRSKWTGESRSPKFSSQFPRLFSVGEMIRSPLPNKDSVVLDGNCPL
jgi:hypothetical protein